MDDATRKYIAGLDAGEKIRKQKRLPELPVSPLPAIFWNRWRRK
jgi:hypothetical protein